jgi:hypothetical protein
MAPRSARTILARLLVGSSLVAASLLVTTTASAFCRSTTCNPKKQECDFDDAGCELSGNVLRWEKSTLVFRFHEKGSSQLVREEARSAVREAFHRWSDTVCPNGERTSLRFIEGEDIVEDKPLDADAEASEAFGIFFRDLGWPHEGVDETLAKTRTLFGNTSGKMTYADIEVNATKPFSLDESANEEATDLQAVMTHEVGHYIGLAHSKAPQSIMAERLCEVDTRCKKGRVAARRLAADDIDAVCDLFPPGPPSSSSVTDGRTPKTSSCASTRAHDRSDATLAGAIGLVVAVALVRRRRNALR